MPLVAFAAGALLGGALFPYASQIRRRDRAWLTAGFATFFVLEQLLQWHQCHRAVSQQGPSAT
jgi:zinc and cadmium transporter